MPDGIELPKRKNRPGQGRKPGIVETRPRLTAARKVAAAAALGRITPLEVMTKTMERAWFAAEDLAANHGDPTQIMLLRAQANDAARLAAPYLHPRLAAIAVKEVAPDLPIDTSGLSAAERQLLLGMLRKVLVKPSSMPDPFNGAAHGPILDHVMPDQDGVEPEDRD